MNNTENLIRMAEKRDIPRILELLVQVNMVHHNGRPDLFKGPATKYTEEELEKIISDDDTPVFVCTDENDTVLGYAFCIKRQIVGSQMMTDVMTLYIDDICVDEKARGKHVGSRIFECVKEYAVRNGYYNITLNVWNFNENAMKFYLSRGMEPQRTIMEMKLGEENGK